MAPSARPTQRNALHPPVEKPESELKSEEDGSSRPVARLDVAYPMMRKVASSLVEDEVTRLRGRRSERQPHRTHSRDGHRGTATLAGPRIAIARPARATHRRGRQGPAGVTGRCCGGGAWRASCAPRGRSAWSRVIKPSRRSSRPWRNRLERDGLDSSAASLENGGDCLPS